MLRREYVTACRKRFTRALSLIRETVVKNDALYLQERSGLAAFARAARRYDFPSDPAGKAGAFMDWLREMVDEEILAIEQRDGQRISLREEWQNLYVRTAYVKGVAQADRLLGWAGISRPEQEIWQIFQQPIHANTLAMLYTRNFEELRGITDAMSQGISRSLTEGLARGWGSAKIARALADQVDGIGIRRATLLARTEVIRAYAEGTLNRFEETGITEVIGDVEFSTAGDARVCPICKALQGRTYTIQEAHGIIPVHPQCRCAWLPVILATNSRGIIIQSFYRFFGITCGNDRAKSKRLNHLNAKAS
jgi:SPP1 gp7 family putative phage head morphogenesis protein